MSLPLEHARFVIDRALGLCRRGLASLRARGWRATWQRVVLEVRPPAALAAQALYAPAPRDVFLPFAVPRADAPRASIVIPVYGQSRHTVQCLRALAEHPPNAPCEIIVVDDASPDDTAQLLGRIDGVRCVRREQNGGFIAACNSGAAVARGEFLVFLNNDTVPQPGWLDALLDTFTVHVDAGLVGAQLLYPDGRLQEAGGVVFADGSAWNYGRFQSPDDPRYAYARDADYLSGAAIAIPRTLFTQLGGFNTHYAPAYYEDTDLAFAVRHAGKRVLYQPAARVAHDEGATAGTDVGTGIKAYQARNRERFAARWTAALARQPAPGAEPTPTVLHRHQQQVLIVDSTTPRPDRDSASLRLRNVMRLLRQEGAHVAFLPVDAAHAGDATHALQQQGVEAWYAPFFSQPAAWLRQHGSRFDAVLLCRHHVAREWLPLVRRYAPQATVAFDSIDLHYLREQRAAQLRNDAAALRQAAATRVLELDVIARSDLTIVVSAAERALLQRDAPDARVEIISNIHELADGVAPLSQRRDILFIGGFRHPPNTDAVHWFISDIWPRVRAVLPHAQFHCVGGDVPAEIAALASRPGVRIHGHVPDLQPFLDGCRLSVAPLRFGAGVKGKINQSMAHGLPVVATPCAVEGMHLHDGGEALIAETAGAFANAVIDLYRDDTLWKALSQAGLLNISTHFSFDAARDAVRRVLSKHT